MWKQPCDESRRRAGIGPPINSARPAEFRRRAVFGGGPPKVTLFDGGRMTVGEPEIGPFAVSRRGEYAGGGGKIVFLPLGERDRIRNETALGTLELRRAVGIHPVVEPVVEHRIPQSGSGVLIRGARTDENGFLTDHGRSIKLVETQQGGLTHVIGRAVVPRIRVGGIVQPGGSSFVWKIVVVVVSIHPEGQSPLFDVAE